MSTNTIQATELLKDRNYLHKHEVEKMAAARKLGRHGQRDALMIMMAYKHGLRVTELIDMTWQQIDFQTGVLHVARLKHGVDSVHPLAGDELRALRAIQKAGKSSFVFASERGGPMTRTNFNKMIERAGKIAELPIAVNPHMLRHSCGYRLANEGVDTRSLQHYLGHRNMQNTVRYTQLSAQRFKGFEKLL